MIAEEAGLVCMGRLYGIERGSGRCGCEVGWQCVRARHAQMLGWAIGVSLWTAFVSSSYL